MYYSNIEIVLQEVPGEISICFSITGCQINCKGCHSPFLWKKESGTPLTAEKYLEVLHKYRKMASCVLFMGGEWHGKELIDFLREAKKRNYNTCLYTGLDKIDASIQEELTWLKTGKWDSSLGGLKSKETNQIFKEVKSNKILNHLFN